LLRSNFSFAIGFTSLFRCSRLAVREPRAALISYPATFAITSSATLFGAGSYAENCIV